MSAAIISPLSRLPGHNPSAQPMPPAPARDDDVRISRSTCRQLSAALDRAMELGLWEHANRVAESAARVSRLSPGLTERIARLRLIQGDHDAALAVIDACPARPASLLLLRNVCLLRAARRGEAHLDLHAWSSRASCPPAARLLLAMLEWTVGDTPAAIDALTRNLRQLDDPQTLAALTALCVNSERTEQSQYWARRLRDAVANTTEAAGADSLLRSLELPGVEITSHVNESHAHALATQLLACEHVIPALVAAQRLETHQESAQLLAAAIELTLDDLEAPAAGFEALARLAIVLDDRDAALDWVRRGIELCPMSAGLVRLSRELCNPPGNTMEQAA